MRKNIFLLISFALWFKALLSAEAGALDASFNPGSGTDGLVEDIALQTDGRIVVCGGFTNYNGAPRKCVARVNSNGSLDTTFNPGAGCDNWVKSCYALSNGKIMLAGWFQNYDNQYEPRIVRLLSN